MPARWLTLTLSTAVLGGCWADHGRGEPPPDEPDAGPVVTCEVHDGVVAELTCPEVVRLGETAEVEVLSYPQLCCASGSPRVSLQREGATHTLGVLWDACECCAECDCLSPTERTTVDLGALLEPGRHTVVAGSQRCEIRVIDDGPIIAPCGHWGGDFRASEHLLDGQPLSVTSTIAESGGCGCQPSVVGASRLDYETEVCGCCPMCDCVDPGYQAGDRGAPLSVGVHQVTFPDGVRAVSVHDRSGCAPMRVTGVRVEPWRDDLVQGGARLTWARVDGEIETCCVDPVPVVERAIAPDGAVALSLLTCHDVDCGCVPTEPRPAGAWLSLGELPPGPVTVRAGELEVSAVVP